MPTLDVVDMNRRKVGSIELATAVFGAAPHPALVHAAVVMQQACERQGTASTLERGEVAGSGKKPWRQKHTGRARAGSIRSPIWRHGGTVFGPRPRSYAFSIPKKQYRAALRSALSAKVASGKLVVVSELNPPDAKTRSLAKLLAQLGLTSSALLVVGADRTELERVAKNLPRVKMVGARDLNVYDVLRYDALVVPEREVARIQEAWA